MIDFVEHSKPDFCVVVSQVQRGLHLASILKNSVAAYLWVVKVHHSQKLRASVSEDQKPDYKGTKSPTNRLVLLLSFEIELNRTA